MQADVLRSYAYGGLALVAFLLVCQVFARSANPLRLVEGADGRASTSKLQWLLWTMVALFSYAAIYAVRSARHLEASGVGLPENLLLATGMSIATATASKAITATYVESGRILKTEVRRPSLFHLFQDDEAYPDFSKIQMMTWTLIGIVIYLSNVRQAVHGIAAFVPDPAMPKQAPPSMPDIDRSLMILMGLGQGGYLAKKLATATPPVKLTGLSPASGPPRVPVRIMGSGLCTAPSGNCVTLDGHPLDLKPQWTDSTIDFVFPATQPDGSAWTKGQIVRLGVVVAGEAGSNDLQFTVTG